MLHHISSYAPKTAGRCSDKRNNTLFLPISQAPTDYITPSLPAQAEIHPWCKGLAELRPEMRTGLAGWGGIESLSPDGPPDPSSLFMHGKGCLELHQQTPEHSSPLKSSLPLGMPLTVVPLPTGRAGLDFRGQTNHREQPHKGRQAPYLGPHVPRHGSTQAGRQGRTKCESAL